MTTIPRHHHRVAVVDTVLQLPWPPILTGRAGPCLNDTLGPESVWAYLNIALEGCSDAWAQTIGYLLSNPLHGDTGIPASQVPARLGTPHSHHWEFEQKRCEKVDLCELWPLIAFWVAKFLCLWRVDKPLPPCTLQKAFVTTY